MPRGWRQDREGTVTTLEKTELRSLQQKLAWLARNSNPTLCFETGQLQQGIEKATVNDILTTNLLADRAKREGRDTKIRPLPWETLELSRPAIRLS